MYSGRAGTHPARLHRCARRELGRALHRRPSAAHPVTFTPPAALSPLSCTLAEDARRACRHGRCVCPARRRERLVACRPRGKEGELARYLQTRNEGTRRAAPVGESITFWRGGQVSGGMLAEGHREVAATEPMRVRTAQALPASTVHALPSASARRC